MSQSSLKAAAVAALAMAAVLAGRCGLSEARPFIPDKKCENETLASVGFSPGDSLLVQGTCTVEKGTYLLGNVNIANGTLLFQDAAIDFWATSILVENGGSLIAGSPAEPIGKNGGVLTIHLYGADQGSNGAGITCVTPADPVAGTVECGIPEKIWNSNVNPTTHMPVAPAGARKISEILAANPGMKYPGQDADPGVIADYFYAYHPLPYDKADAAGYFGYKVLAVSYGGTLQLFGKKGATYCTSPNCDVPPAGCPADVTDCIPASSSGTSWVRLDATAKQGTSELVVDRPVFWQKDDEIVVTSTDYLPGHSEHLTVAADVNGGTTVTVNETLGYDHIGVRFPLSVVPDGVLDPKLKAAGAEIRAAVALLTRSIAIVSEGKALNPSGSARPGQPLDCPSGQPGCVPSDNYFGGHTIVRQGAQKVQVQGVEFYQLGQGGRLGHYPVHFHHARRTPNGTFVKDSSINESMTRFIVLHGTHNVLLARNVGYKSIGHGFYLEDGTEIDNRLLSNIGILARAAVDNAQNDRKVPGILVAPDLAQQDVEHVPYRSDADHPTVFWVMNAWNDFQYNAAVGATGCGVCYWLLPGWNSGMSQDTRWETYASLQSDKDRAGTTPLKSFIGNSCSAAMMSFYTVGDTAVCHGVGNPGGGFPFLAPINNALAPQSPFADPDNASIAAAAAAYYPNVVAGGSRLATRCPDGVLDCSATGPKAPKICTSDLSAATGNDNSETNCVITVLDHYTSSFTWADFNFAAIWLRPQWYLVTDSVITDIQNGGLNFVTGGGYSASDRVNGHWALVRKSVFIGSSQQFLAERTGTDQPVSPYALDGGPFNPFSKLYCGALAVNGQGVTPGNYCLSHDDGVSFPTSNFGMSQRFFSVYDGPAFQESNAYLDIKARIIGDCTPFIDGPNLVGRCDANFKDQAGLTRTQSAWIAGHVQGLLKGKDAQSPHPAADVCYMPNAAIGWKQPNGFYYPPAFHSKALFFDNVDIRHFVIEPLFKPGTFTTDVSLDPDNPVTENYCLYNRELFTGFTDVDRQTVLNDDDGSLTGYKNTIVVNLNDVFTGPSEGVECRSADTSKVSPYAHVTTVVYPRCAVDGTCAQPLPKDEKLPNPHIGLWDQACSNQFCYGVPLYRQLLVPDDGGVAPSIRMMGQAIGQRSTLTSNHGVYYLDTTVSQQDQMNVVCPANNRCNINVFRGNQTYYVFMLYAAPTTRQTYQIYVGKTPVGQSPIFNKLTDVWLTQADIRPVPAAFTPPGANGWPTNWIRDYDPASGILTVTVDLSDFGQKFLDGREPNCRPKTFCSWNEASGKCTDSAGDDSVCRWAVDYLDCPDGGCFGFGFTLPAEFATSPSPNPRPDPDPFPSNADWNVCFSGACQSVAGACFKSPVTQPASCVPPVCPTPSQNRRQQGRGGPFRTTR